MKMKVKTKILPAIVMLLSLPLSGCFWIMAPMMGVHAVHNEDKEDAGRTFRKKLERADTPQEHRLIAESYRQDAEKYRLLAKEQFTQSKRR